MQHYKAKSFRWTRFWDDFCAQISGDLWVPDPNLPSKEISTNSWFNITRKKNPNNHDHNEYLPNLTGFNTCDSGTMKSRTIKLKPTPIQRTILMRWFGQVRQIYNSTVLYINSVYTLEGQYPPSSHVTIRKAIEPLMDRHSWYRTIPAEVRNGVYRLVASSIKGEKTKCDEARKKHRRRPFPVFSLLSKRNSYSITIENGCASPKGIYSTKTGKGMKFCEDLSGINFDTETKLIYHTHKDGRTDFYLSVPQDVVVQQAEPERRVIALDPGIRTFLTGYDTKRVTEICTDFGKVNNRFALLDIYRSKMARATQQRRKHSFEVRIEKVLSGITNMITDMHRKTAKWLCERYDHIILPRIGIKDIARKMQIPNVNRKMYVLSHYRFRQTLVHKAREFRTAVVVSNEAWTSKTCSCCGYIKRDLGANKTYDCNGCGRVLDRDVNGARNILIRAIKGC